MAILDTVAVASLGVYSELYGLGEEANIAVLYVSFGYLEDASPAEEGFEAGDFLIRQPLSEDYVNDDVTFTRQPFSEDYIDGDGNTFIRQPFSENYLDSDGVEYIRQPFSEDRATTLLRFVRQPFSEDYLVEDL